MVDRKGYVISVSVGTNFDIDFPLKTRLRSISTRLSGFRVLYTKLNQKTFSKKEKNMLMNQRLDALGSIHMDAQGRPDAFHLAHLHPEISGLDSIDTQSYPSILDIDLPFDSWISELERQFEQIIESAYIIEAENNAVLCYLITPDNKATIAEEIEETMELCRTAGLRIKKTLSQSRKTPDPRFFYGKGKAKELVQEVIAVDADMILFHQNLTPTQFRVLGDHTEVALIDRTQLILDIFAQHAKTHEGKLQVELAQLQYTLPRLREKNTQMSRLAGGIGGRGPGETKLEIHRRRARQKIERLKKDLQKIKANRARNRKSRNKKNIPIISIVGYTNAGKSTLLNTLTKAQAQAEHKLFATLDPFSKRMRFPKDQEVIMTDTVGFIRELPPALMEAFEATLEEISFSSLIIHLIDASNPQWEKHISVVDNILSKLELTHIPQIKVFNKSDQCEPESIQHLAQLHDGFAVCAQDRKTLLGLIQKVETMILQPGDNNATFLL